MKIKIPDDKNLYTALFSQLPEYADSRGQKYDQTQILSLVALGLLEGANDFVNIEKVLKQNEKMILETFGLESLPSHDTLGDRLNKIDPEEFSDLFSEWAQSILPEKSKNIAIDGKALRGSALTSQGESVPVIVDCVDMATGLCLGAGYVSCKRSEIKVAPEVLDRLDIVEVEISGDAAMSAPDIRETVCSDEGEFMMPAKKNRGQTYEDICKIFEEIFQIEQAKKEIEQICPEGASVVAFYSEGDYTMLKTVEKGHGRVECREYHLLTNLENCQIKNASDVKSIGLAIRTVEKPVACKGPGNKKSSPEEKVKIKKSVQKVPFIMSLTPTIEHFAKVARGEWTVENGLHYPLDMVLLEDRSTIRRVELRYVMAIVRRIVYNLLVLAELDKNETFQGKRIILTHHPFLALKLIIGPYKQRAEELGRVYILERLERIKEDLDIPPDEWEKVRCSIIQSL